MKLWLLLFAFVNTFSSYAQEAERRYDYPIIVTLHFPAFATPFRNLDLNFRNVGIGVGTEVTLNNDGTWVQQLQLAWMQNRAAGNSLLVYTQLAWRPGGNNEAFGEIKVGIGYSYGFTAAPAQTPIDGKWVPNGHRGKGMLAIPIGIAAGYHFYEGASRYSPFLGYQFLIVAPYNKTIPLIPQTIVQTGLSISR